MAGHECLNVQRSSRRQAALTDRIELTDQVRAIPDHAGDTAARIDDERAMSEVRRILDKIPAKQREVVELVVWSECSMAEAARALGVPEGTVKSRLARARSSLAGLIEIGSMEGLL
jgi:RNA polymerase sigma-70 factor (ECF subfamily)